MWLVPLNVVSGNLPYELGKGVHVVGRLRSCDLSIGDDTLSRKHARLTRLKSHELVVEDLGSKNGTYIDDVRVTRHVVTERCIIRFGAVSLFLSRPVSMMSSGAVRDSDSTKQQHAEPTPFTELVEQLTISQRNVFDLLLKGLEEAEIGERLKRSVHTVHNHVRAIYQVFDVHSRTELFAKLLQKKS